MILSEKFCRQLSFEEVRVSIDGFKLPRLAGSNGREGRGDS